MKHYQMSRVNSARFKKSNLKLTSIVEIEVDNTQTSRIYYGDIVGTSEYEIVVISNSKISIYDPEGKLINEKTFEDNNLGRALLADIDGDGKKDIIIGGHLEKGVRLMGFSGVLTPLFDISHGELYDGFTTPHFFHNGKIYFTAVSRLDIPPKISGTCDPINESIEWKFFSGPIATDIAANADFTKLAISNYPKNAAGLTAEDKQPIEHSKHKSSLYILNSEGSLLLQKSLGGQFNTNKPLDNTISLLTQRITDIDGDGTEELLCGLSHLSEFYQGYAAIATYTLEGEPINRRNFEPNTELEFSFFNTKDGAEIGVMLKQAGKLYLLNSNLDIKHEWKSPFGIGEGMLHECGDFNGDGKVEYLISMNNYLYILDSELKHVFSTASPQVISKAGIIPSKDGPVLYTLADKLNLYTADTKKVGTLSVFTDPPGADLYLNGQLLEQRPVTGLLPPLSPGKYEIEARLGEFSSGINQIEIENGKHLQIELDVAEYGESPEPEYKSNNHLTPVRSPEIPPKTFEDFRLVSHNKKKPELQLIYRKSMDMAGDAKKDLMFKDATTGEITVYSTDMEKISSFMTPFHRYLYVSNEQFDIDCNSKSELLFCGTRRQNYTGYTADGKIVQQKSFSYFSDTKFNGNVILENNILYFTQLTGYALQPRGLLGVRIDNTNMDFFTPTSGWSIDILYTAENYIIPAYSTPSNGGLQTLKDGRITDDSNYFIHILDTNGNLLPQSFNPELPDNNGQMKFYSIDTNSDGKFEVYLATQKDRYYTGTCGIYKIDTANGTAQGPLYSSETDYQMELSQSVLNGKPVITATVNRIDSKNWEIHILDTDFSFLKKITIENGFNPLACSDNYPDIDADGNMEIIIIEKESAVIYDHNMKIIRRFKLSENDGGLQAILLDDTDYNGKEEFILVAKNSVSIYSY